MAGMALQKGATARGEKWRGQRCPPRVCLSPSSPAVPRSPGRGPSSRPGRRLPLPSSSPSHPALQLLPTDHSARSEWRRRTREASSARAREPETRGRGSGCGRACACGTGPERARQAAERAASWCADVGGAGFGVFAAPRLSHSILSFLQ